jgi:hypothetical protein
VDRVIRLVDALLPTSARVARLAGELQAKTQTTDVVDAIVAAEALLSVPSLIMTSDPHDLARLIEEEAGAIRVRAIAV